MKMDKKDLAVKNSAYYYSLGMLNMLRKLSLVTAYEYENIVTYVKDYYGFEV